MRRKVGAEPTTAAALPPSHRLYNQCTISISLGFRRARDIPGANGTYSPSIGLRRGVRKMTYSPFLGLVHVGQDPGGGSRRFPVHGSFGLLDERSDLHPRNGLCCPFGASPGSWFRGRMSPFVCNSAKLQSNTTVLLLLTRILSSTCCRTAVARTTRSRSRPLRIRSSTVSRWSIGVVAWAMIGP